MSTSTALPGRAGGRARRTVAAALTGLGLAGGLLAAFSLGTGRTAVTPIGGAVSTGQTSIASVERDRWYRETPVDPAAGRVPPPAHPLRDRWYAESAAVPLVGAGGDRWYRDPSGSDADSSTAARDRWYRAD
jgi:hypothetical protein